MIGPAAWEELYCRPPATPQKYLEIEYQGHLYKYDVASAVWLFDYYQQFRTWCEKDVRNNNGEYADEIEVIA